MLGFSVVPILRLRMSLNVRCYQLPPIHGAIEKFLWSSLLSTGHMFGWGGGGKGANGEGAFRSKKTHTRTHTYMRSGHSVMHHHQSQSFLAELCTPTVYIHCVNNRKKANKLQQRIAFDLEGNSVSKLFCPLSDNTHRPPNYTATKKFVALKTWIFFFKMTVKAVRLLEKNKMVGFHNA